MIISIFELILLYLPLILGAYLAISLMQIPNLAIESSFLMGAIIGSLFTNYFANHVFLSLGISLMAAGVAGGLTGLLVACLHLYGKLSLLLSNIVTIGATYGFSIVMLGGSHLTLNQHNNPLLIINFITNYPMLPTLIFITILISSLMFYFFKTNLGRICAVYGHNLKFLAAHKISTNYVLCVGLTIANFLAGICGYLVAQNNGFVDTSMSKGIALLSITALMIGKIFLKSKPIDFKIPILGTAGYFLLQTSLMSLGFDLLYFPLIQAAALTGIFISQNSRHHLNLGV